MERKQERTEGHATWSGNRKEQENRLIGAETGKNKRTGYQEYKQERAGGTGYLERK